ncbi:MAG: AAA family ATPase [Candidatus Synoicihabitans palmerolidicus]|nr:AAA family ATPase [Candidatus Synoicihabitans palmerolidicus]
MSDELNEGGVSVLLVLAGPAGSGKTTLCERMVAKVQGFSRVVTTTSREPRPGEVNGVHYHFFSAEEFDRRLEENAFLEWAWVHRKNRYGTLASSVLDPLAAGRSLIINVDVQGVDNFLRAAAADPLLARHMGTVYIDVPIEELRARLIGRGESEAEIERRMITAEKEQQKREKFDYVITSASKEADFAELRKIWQQRQALVRSSD